VDSSGLATDRGSDPGGVMYGGMSGGGVMSVNLHMHARPRYAGEMPTGIMKVRCRCPSCMSPNYDSSIVVVA